MLANQRCAAFAKSLCLFKPFQSPNGNPKVNSVNYVYHIVLAITLSILTDRLKNNIVYFEI